MKNLLYILALVFSLSGCSGDDVSLDTPEGQYRVVEKICYCSFPNDGSIEYWIFDSNSNIMSIRRIDSEGQLLGTEEMFYGRNGGHLVIGEGREYTFQRKNGLLELTYLDNEAIADDELVVKLASY